ncbi:MAG: hypothetical protein HY702_05065 [Gemmatimonadetes bacterium]|nr:hypothetical protein [Gemmatimonadota bacterium]
MLAHDILRAVVCTVVPEAAALDEPGWAHLETLVEDALRSRPRSLQRRVRLFLRLIQWMPLARYGRPFTSLDPGRRARFLRSLENHRLRLIHLGFWGLRTLVLLGYYGRPEAAQAIGYAAHPRGWEAFRR